MINRYCYTCGKQLVFYKKKSTGYNTLTGAKEFHFKYRCPELNIWWKRWLNEIHMELMYTSDQEA